MLILKLFLSILVLRLSEGEVQDESVYTVIAPAKFRPNMAYHVSVSAHNMPSPLQMTIGIEGPSDSGNNNNVSKTVTLGSGETQIIKFEIGEWNQGNYSLVVLGNNGKTFQNRTALTFEPKSYSVFVQTDKAIYKPEQLVQFRVIVINPNLLPGVTGAIDMFITDASGNRIKQWNRVFTTRGIVSEELKLSDQPVFGDWTIHVDILGQVFKKSFTVAEYVLPMFDVNIELPSYATYNKSKIVATIKAHYSYGKPVKGEVTVKAAPVAKYGFVSISKTVDIQSKINGEANIEMNLVDDLRLKSDFVSQEVEISAEVEEELTGRKYNTSKIIKVFDRDIKLELIKTSKSFKPGLKFTTVLKVAHQDDTPIDKTNDLLILNHTYTYNDDKGESRKYSVPLNGLIELEFYPPKGKSVSFLNLYADFRGVQYILDSTDAALSPSDNFIQATLLTKNPKVEQLVDISVNATEPLTQVFFKVLGRGDLVFAGVVQVQNNTTHSFNFMITSRMAPKARVIVYYVRKENNEIVADSINFDVEGLFRTPVTIETSINETKPGGDVDIIVNTKPNAYVGILAVDQSILQLKSGNDITQQSVIDELETYDSGKKKSWQPLFRRKRSLWWPGSPTAGEVFDDAGVVILTNGLLHRFVQLIMYRSYSVELSSTIEDSDSSLSKKDEVSRVRKHFPETWIWNGSYSSNEGNVVLSTSVPDTITSWIISAFAMDTMTGFGIAPETAKVTVFRPFFIKLNLPYSIIRGESMSIQAVIFNYHNKAIKAEVTLENEKDEFEFVIAGNEVIVQDEKKKTKIVEIPAQDGSSVSFLITPKKLGYIDIKVGAISKLAGDAVLRKLLVKPEGTPQYFNKAILVDLRHPNSKPPKANISVVIPDNAVDGSQRISLSAIGDLLGPSVNNLDKLLHMPFGCGEQNMINFVPNIVVTQYLERVGRLSATIKSTALAHMESGYQRELTYKREDSSFSAFGERDKSGSTWLTAFVIKSFAQARPYIDIDEKIIEMALQWLAQKQKKNGSFKETGEVHHKAMQGGSGSGAALTAYVLIAFSENKAQVNYSKEMDLATQYVLQELQSSSDPYVVSIIAYALHLLNHADKDSAFQKLQSLAKREVDLLYWSKSTQNLKSTHVPQSQDVEMTSYALLTYSLRDDVGPALPIIRWLISQQNENGGYSSTQDTVIGIQALASMASRLASSTVSINVKYSVGEDRSKNLNITSENAMVLQKVELPSTVKSLELEATGFGVGIVQLSWSYNIAVKEEKPSFSLKPNVRKSSNSYFHLDICTQYKESGSSNMAVMEIALPSGYLADKEGFNDLHKQALIKRVDVQDEDTTVVIYFDRIDQQEICMTVPAQKEFNVANLKPVPIKVYDYYNLAKSARAFYQPQEVSVCNICDGEDCTDSCAALRTSAAAFTRCTLLYIKILFVFLVVKLKYFY